MTPKILVFAGSLRAESYNKQLVKVAAKGAEKAGAEIKFIDLREFPLPVFDEDLEEKEGLHPNARKLKDLFLASQGFLISSPEYNSSFPAAFKNAIDWISRPVEGEKSFEPFDGKVAGIMTASPGALGGIRCLPQVRLLLSNIRMLVVPEQMALGMAHEAFDASGMLKNPKQQAMVEGIGAAVVKLLRK